MLNDIIFAYMFPVSLGNETEVYKGKCKTIYKNAYPKILFSAIGIREQEVGLWNMERNVEGITCREKQNKPIVTVY